MVLTRRHLRSALLGLAIVAALAGMPAGAATADVPDDGITIDVEVLGPSATPVPSPSSTRNSTGSGSTTPQPQATEKTDEGLGDDAIDLGGVLYVGGLRASVAPSVGAQGGDAQLSITMRNTSDELADFRLHFWVQNGFGATIGEVTDVQARDVKPGETRTVRVTVTTVGQWTLLTAHAKVTPPKELNGVALTSVTRDASLVVPPYFLLASGAVIVSLYFAIRFLLTRRLFGIGVPA